MNAQYLGRWDVAPRGHPNDGRVDVLPRRRRRCRRATGCRARAALPQGTHVPHPQLADSPGADGDRLTFDRPVARVARRRALVDRGRAHALTVEPDALLVCV